MALHKHNVALSGWKNLPVFGSMVEEIFDNSWHYNKATVQIYGSSLIRDLFYHAQNTAGLNTQLNIPGIHVVWNGNPGHSVARVVQEFETNTHPAQGRRSLSALRLTQPEVVVYVWLGNDIDNGEDPDQTAWRACQMAQFGGSLNEHTQSYVCSVLPRTDPFYLDPAVYKVRAKECNDLLEYRLNTRENWFPNVHYHKCERFENATVQLLTVAMIDI